MVPPLSLLIHPFSHINDPRPLLKSKINAWLLAPMIHKAALPGYGLPNKP